jgi:hypothetical protein
MEPQISRILLFFVCEICVFSFKKKDFDEKIRYLTPYPFAIHEGTLYQLIEDADEEEWAVHITKIK